LLNQFQELAFEGGAMPALRCDDGGRIRLLHGVHLTGLSAHHQWSASAEILAATSDSGKNGIHRAITIVMAYERF
jgi:hypothetical protein